MSRRRTAVLAGLLAAALPHPGQGDRAPTLCHDAEENASTGGPPAGKAQLGSFKVKPFKTSAGVEYTAYREAVKVKGIPYSVRIRFADKRASPPAASSTTPSRATASA